MPMLNERAGLTAAFCFAAALPVYLLSAPAAHPKQPPQPSDADIRHLIIQESIASYPGPCACPYSSARNGSRCGRRSAYRRPGGYPPLCYDRDVSDEQVRAYRQEHGVVGQ